MKKRYFLAILMAALAVVFCFSACSKSEEAPAEEPAEQAAEAPAEETAAEPVVDGSAYGYAGEDPVECAAYQFMVEEVSKNFEPADASIPTVNIVAVDYTNPDEVLLYGDFWIENYNIEGDTLECVSGGNFPGVMHVTKDGDSYVVSSMDFVADGAGFDESARELFGDHYDAFMAVYSDSDARDELRKITVSDYVNLNGLPVTKYQDYGWDPVDLYLS